MSEFVRLEVADGVATLRLDRPKMNALNVQVQEEIRAAAAEATDRDDVKAVVVYGGEKVFAAGADVKEMADMSYTDMVQRSGRLQSAFTAVARIPDVMECHLMAGTADYILKVVAEDTEDYARIHRQYLTRLPGVAQMQSSFALKTVFKTTALPV